MLEEKTVNVEVRKKRTYVKLDDSVDIEQPSNSDKLFDPVSVDAEDKSQASVISPDGTSGCKR